LTLHLATPLSFDISRNMRDLRDRLSHVSSGRRVEKAADDPAGMAVSTQMGAVAASKRVAIRNIEHALDALDTADGGLQEVSDHLVRLRELATQAATETLTDDDRAHIQTEFAAMVDGLNHAATSTSWQNKPLLSFETVDVGLIVDVSGSMGGEIAATQAAIEAFRQTFLDAGLNVGLGLSVMGVDTIDGVTRRADIASADFVTELSTLGVEMWGPMSPYSSLLNAGGAEDNPGVDDPDAYTWRANPKRRVLVLITDTGQELALVGYSGAQVGGMLAARDIEVHTINPIGQNSVFDPITSATGGQTWSIGDASGSGISTALDSIATDLADELGTTTTFEVQVSHGSGDENRIDLQMPMDATANGLGLSSVTVTTVEEARAAMDALDDAIDTLSGIQTHVGVSHNRLMFALENETTALENTEAARSRILDADMAAETAALAREQILAQASVGMAAQAWKLEKEVLERILESQ
jgi:flagellin